MHAGVSRRVSRCVCVCVCVLCVVSVANQIVPAEVFVVNPVTPPGALLRGAAESGAAVTPLPERGRRGSSLARRTWRARDRNAGNQWRKTTERRPQGETRGHTHTHTHDTTAGRDIRHTYILSICNIIGNVLVVVKLLRLRYALRFFVVQTNTLLSHEFGSGHTLCL